MVGVGDFGFSSSAAGGLDRLIEAALTAADFGRGCTGAFATGELRGASSDLDDWMDEIRFSGVVFAGAEAALALGLRRLGPLARLLVMWVS